MNDIIYYQNCNTYEYEAIFCAVERLFSNTDKSVFAGKKVVIKPNLLLKSSPEKHITTNPLIVEAVAKILYAYGAKSVIIAESPGGPYTESSLKIIYSANGIKDAAERSNALLNYDTGYTEIFDNENRYLKVFNMINPINNAEIIVNISKLKAHALTTMSGAIKNLFGVVPGIQKFETHARFPDHTDFANAILDICASVHRKSLVYNITDAVIGLEGNGPSTSGIPRKIGYIAMSENPYNLDLFNSHMIGFDNKVEMIELAKERGLCKKSFDELSVEGDNYGNTVMNDFLFPDSKTLSIFKHIPKFLMPGPVINKKLCRGCRKCVKSCPEHTIDIKNGIASISNDKCIKCFCCQELCPYHAVLIHENFIYKLVRGIEKII